MVTVKIKGTACSLYNVYTVVTASHGITARLWYIREVIPWLGSYTMGSYKVLVYIVQATYTIALSWFIELHARGTCLNHSASPRGLNTRLSRTIQINHSSLYCNYNFYVYYTRLNKQEYNNTGPLLPNSHPQTIS